MGETVKHWSCNVCGQTDGTENGVCPKCGPTQTTPLSEQAKKEAGVVQVKKEKPVEESAEKSATDK